LKKAVDFLEKFTAEREESIAKDETSFAERKRPFAKREKPLDKCQKRKGKTHLPRQISELSAIELSLSGPSHMVRNTMQTKYVIITVALVLGFALMAWLRSRSISPAAVSTQQVSLAGLSQGERHVYDLLREVQGHAILTESLSREGGDVKAQLTLDTNKTTVSRLNINLSSLARKQKDDGLSDGAVKRGFTF
jgi:hypothetical protein